MIAKAAPRSSRHILRNKRSSWSEAGLVAEGLGVGKEDNTIVAKHENWQFQGAYCG